MYPVAPRSVRRLRTRILTKYCSVTRLAILVISVSSIYLVYLSICLSIYLSTYLSIYLSISLSLSLSVRLSIYLSIYLPFFLSIYLSIYLSSLSIYLSISLSLSVRLSIYLSIHLSIYPYIRTYLAQHAEPSEVRAHHLQILDGDALAPSRSGVPCRGVWGLQGFGCRVLGFGTLPRPRIHMS